MFTHAVVIQVSTPNGPNWFWIWPEGQEKLFLGTDPRPHLPTLFAKGWAQFASVDVTGDLLPEVLFFRRPV